MSNTVSDRELDKESLDAFEIGYRRTLGNGKGSFNLNVFHYRYDDVFARIGASATPELFVPRPYLNVQGTYDNLLEGDATGFEAFLDWDFSDSLGISLTYSHLSDSFQSLIDSTDPFVRSSIQFSINEFDHSTPNNMATLNLRAQLSDSWDLDTGLRFSQSYNFAKGLQPSIFQMDSRLSWQIKDDVRLSLIGRNLLDPKTQEARLKDFFGHWTEMKREIYLEVKAEF